MGEYLVRFLNFKGDLNMLSKIASFDFGNLKYCICLSVCIIVFVFQVFAEIPDTGQTKCYDDTKEIPCPKPGQDYYGQDANYIIKPDSYTLMAGGAMVKDNVTGLIWENKTTDGSIHDADKRFSWHDAKNVFIAQLNVAMMIGACLAEKNCAQLWITVESRVLMLNISPILDQDIIGHPPRIIGHLLAW